MLSLMCMDEAAQFSVEYSRFVLWKLIWLADENSSPCHASWVSYRTDPVRLIYHLTHQALEYRLL